jgi:hypothetical protein
MNSKIECSHCGITFTRKSSLVNHAKSFNKCAYNRVKKENEKIKLENEQYKMKYERLKKENEELKRYKLKYETLQQNPTNVTYNQTNVLNVNTKSVEEYFQDRKGLPKIDVNDFTFRNKIDGISTNMVYEDPNKIDINYFFERVFPPKDIAESIVVRDSRRNKVDIKYAGRVKPFEEHDDLICDVQGFGNECVEKAVKKGMKNEGKVEISRSGINKCKRQLTNNIPNKTWKKIKENSLIDK